MRGNSFEQLEQRRLLAVTVYGDQGSFLSALSNSVTADFEPGSGFATAQLGQLTPVGVKDGVEWDGAVTRSSNVAPVSGAQIFTGSSGLDDTAVVEFNSDRPTGIGFFALDIDAGEVVRVAVEFENGENRLFDVRLDGASPKTPRFFGVIDPQDRIVDVAIFAQTDGQLISGLQTWALDDFTYNRPAATDPPVTDPPVTDPPVTDPPITELPPGLGDFDDSSALLKTVFDSLQINIELKVADLRSAVDQGISKVNGLAGLVKQRAGEAHDDATELLAAARQLGNDLGVGWRSALTDMHASADQAKVNVNDIVHDATELGDRLLGLVGGPSAAAIQARLYELDSVLEMSAANVDRQLDAAQTLISEAEVQLAELLNQAQELIDSYKPIRGDLNGDRMVSAADIDYLFERLGRPYVQEPALDLDGNARIDSGDVRYLVEEILHTHYGDLNLNGKVDFEDFLVLSNHFGEQNTGWAFGNLNGDNATDFKDFLILAQNYGAGV